MKLTVMVTALLGFGTVVVSAAEVSTA